MMGFSHLNSVKLLLILLLASFTNAQKQIGDNCQRHNFKNGKCVFLENCPSAIKLLREEQQPPALCSFQGKQPIVCCEAEGALKLPGQISTRKCLDFFKKDDKFIDDLLADPNRHAAVGGVDAPSKAFPHMIALGYDDTPGIIIWGCGGTLISEKFVLTAAHCIFTQIGPVRYARAGDLNLRIDTDDAKPQNFNISRTVLHPGYKPPSSYNDIAIVELSRNAVFNRYVLPACLQTDTNINATIWSATGWGRTSFDGKQADHLQRILVREYPWTDCQRAYASEGKRRLSNGIDWKSQICAGENSVDVCQGDSGGPLQVQRSRIGKPGYFVIGVVAFGKACGIANVPSVYTRVSNYIDWIESVVWPDEA